MVGVPNAGSRSVAVFVQPCRVANLCSAGMSPRIAVVTIIAAMGGLAVTIPVNVCGIKLARAWTFVTTATHAGTALG
jgi:hypothetical protein